MHIGPPENLHNGYLWIALAKTVVLPILVSYFFRVISGKEVEHDCTWSQALGCTTVVEHVVRYGYAIFRRRSQPINNICVQLKPSSAAQNMNSIIGSRSLTYVSMTPSTSSIGTEVVVLYRTDRKTWLLSRPLGCAGPSIATQGCPVTCALYTPMLYLQFPCPWSPLVQRTRINTYLSSPSNVNSYPPK